MADKKANAVRGSSDVDVQKIYLLLCALKKSVDQLALQVKALRNHEQETGKNE